MGDVYKANDSRLSRSVAIKVSAEKFSERSESEARAVAALNHPNICTLYDVGPNYLVMELIEGDTLSDRIKQGPLPLNEALDIARQIADALTAAHERGIIHRDLKPANIKIRPDGSVKVLDFGLAKMDSAIARSNAKDGQTMTVAMSEPGMILGTAAYMAPEQARGKTVDKRADIWAFGVVLWEMLTGQQLFEGETITDVLAAVVQRDFDWNRVPPRTRRLLRSCLERDARKRLQDIGDARLLLDEEAASPVAAAATPAAPQTVHSVSLVMGSKIAWGAAALFLVLLAALAWRHFREKPPAAEAVRFQVSLPDKIFFKALALSPDGRYLAFTGTTAEGVDHLWIRALDTVEARILPGTDGATSPFWSPDSRFLAFSVGGKLKKIDVLSGAPPLTLCEIPGISGQGTWNSDNVIVFGSRTGNASGLRRISGNGGTPEMITAPDPERKESTLSFPQFMPDGKHFIYLRISSDAALSGIYTASLDTKPADAVSKRILPSGREAVYVPSSKQLLFNRGTTLMAQPFDAARMEVSGDAVPINDPIGAFGAFGWFTASPGSILAYRLTGESQRQITSFDSKGATLGHLGDPALYRELAISPDGRKVVAYQQNDQFDLWMFDLARGGKTRFTFTPGFDRYPVWSPESNQIAYCAGTSNDEADIYRKASNGATEPELLLKIARRVICPQDWSHDGKYLLYADVDNTKVDLWVLPLAGKPGEAKPAPFLTGHFNNLFARFSPDGRWIAYTSNESGKNEIFVRPFTPGGSSMAGEGKWMVSNAGGSQPHWSRDGKKLFYWQETGKLMSVDIEAAGSSFKPGIPAPLFDLPIGTPGTSAGVVTSIWDMTPDGSQILGNTQQGPSATGPVTVVLNWQAALKR
jgi:Tol biopolymer transport system component